MPRVGGTPTAPSKPPVKTVSPRPKKGGNVEPVQKPTPK